MPADLYTIAQALHALTARGLPRLEAQMLLLHALGQPTHARAWLLAHDGDAVPAAAAEALHALAARRQAGEPVAYLVGQQAFHGLTLQVDARVLDPRDDTETLVDWALALWPPGGGAGPVAAPVDVLDLGTGSGAIALALAHQRPHSRVTAVDASADALAVAAANAQRLALAVAMRHGSWFEPVAGERFHLIVSNPPYIDALDPHLSEGDVRFEPRSALVADAAGLADLAQIIRLAPDHLLPGGWLLLEHGWQQGGTVRELLQQRGFLSVATVRDYGDQERVSLGQWYSSQEGLPS